MAQKTRKTEIVNAAQELFSTFGFEKTTMTDIAKKLGISKASLYYYFSDKESIIQSLAVKEQEQFVLEIQNVISDSMSAREKLVFYSGKRMELLQKDLTLSSTNLITYASIKSIFCSILTDFRKQEITLVSEILRIGIEKGEIREIDILEHAELYLEVLRGLRKNAFFNPGKINQSVLQPLDIKKTQKQAKFFTAIFIQGISK